MTAISLSMAEFSDLLNRFMTEIFDLKAFCGIAAGILVVFLPGGV